MAGTMMSLGNRKLVVLGVPWDVDTDGLRQYMNKYGELDDVIVMKDRATGRSRGFGYVTFTSPADAEKALATQHLLNGRMLEVKVATPKEDMRPVGKKNTRVFVARIPPVVSEQMFRSYFEKYGTITDAYMPKDQGTKAHRGIGFITYENPDSVDRLMSESHELGGSAIAVDRATPKEETGRYWDKLFPAYGVFNSYINAARLGAFGMPPFGAYDYMGSAFPPDLAGPGMGAAAYGAANMWQPPLPPPPTNMVPGPTGATGPIAPTTNYGSTAPPAPPPPPKPMGKKVFIGRIPPEATVDDVRLYFGDYGRILDVYLPKDKNKTSHRGFGFVTFAEEATAERVAQRSHELFGHQLAVDRATPVDDNSNSAAFYNSSAPATTPSVGGVGGPIRGNTSSAPSSGYGNVDYNPWAAYSGGVGPVSTNDPAGRASRTEPRYRPY